MITANSNICAITGGRIFKVYGININNYQHFNYYLLFDQNLMSFLRSYLVSFYHKNLIHILLVPSNSHTRTYVFLKAAINELSE